MDMGERLSGPEIALKCRAKSSTVRAIGPVTESVLHPNGATDGTRPGDGLNPTTLLKLAGLRREPPKSVPSAIGIILQANETPAPPLLPPHVLEVSNGLTVEPNTGLNVLEPAPN